MSTQDESKILRWWGVRSLKGKYPRWEPMRFTAGQKTNMEKYYEIIGPYEDRTAASLAG